VFHVKRFGTIDAPRKRTFAARGGVRSGDFGQAESCDKVERASSGVPVAECAANQADSFKAPQSEALNRASQSRTLWPCFSLNFGFTLEAVM